MLTTQWEPLKSSFEPWSEMNRLRDEVHRLFGRYGDDQRSRFGANIFPALNLWEDDDILYAEAELAGFELDELEIYVTAGNQLSIKGERKPPDAKGGAWRRLASPGAKLRRV